MASILIGDLADWATGEAVDDWCLAMNAKMASGRAGDTELLEPLMAESTDPLEVDVFATCKTCCSAPCFARRGAYVPKYLEISCNSVADAIL